MRGDTKTAGLQVAGQKFQSTLPMWGDTCTTAGSLYMTFQFQSTLPMRGDTGGEAT